LSNVEFTDSPVRRSFELQRSDAFHYTCNRCLKCCRNKAIPLNPYEVLRLARNRGISTGEFIEKHTADGEGSSLKFHDAEHGGACEFLDEQGCTVHPDRPLACRLYPLARWTAGEGIEAYAQVDPEPGSLGVYEGPGTVGDFIGSQVVEPHFAAADLCLGLYTKMAQVAARVESGKVSPESLPDGNWLDVDWVTGRYAAESGQALPSDLNELARLHVQIVEAWLAPLL